MDSSTPVNNTSDRPSGPSAPPFGKSMQSGAHRTPQAPHRSAPGTYRLPYDGVGSSDGTSNSERSLPPFLKSTRDHRDFNRDSRPWRRKSGGPGSLPFHRPPPPQPSHRQDPTQFAPLSAIPKAPRGDSRRPSRDEKRRPSTSDSRRGPIPRGPSETRREPMGDRRRPPVARQRQPSNGTATASSQGIHYRDAQEGSSRPSMQLNRGLQREHHREPRPESSASNGLGPRHHVEEEKTDALRTHESSREMHTGLADEGDYALGKPSRPLDHNLNSAPATNRDIHLASDLLQKTRRPDTGGKHSRSESASSFVPTPKRIKNCISSPPSAVEVSVNVNPEKSVDTVAMPVKSSEDELREPASKELDQPTTEHASGSASDIKVTSNGAKKRSVTDSPPHQAVHDDDNMEVDGSAESVADAPDDLETKVKIKAQAKAEAQAHADKLNPSAGLRHPAEILPKPVGLPQDQRDIVHFQAAFAELEKSISSANLPYLKPRVAERSPFRCTSIDLTTTRIVSRRLAEWEHATWRHAREWRRLDAEWHSLGKKLDKEVEDRKNSIERESASAAPAPETVSHRRSRSQFGDAARTEAEFLEILANLERQTARDPLIRARMTSATIPNQRQRPAADLARFVDTNDLITDKCKLSERLRTDMVDTFTSEEHSRFCEAFVLFPKEFGRIAEQVGDGRNFNECVMHYYHTKKTTDYKKLLLKRRPKAKRGRKRKSPSASNAQEESGVESVEPVVSVVPNVAEGVTPTKSDSANLSTSATSPAEASEADENLNQLSTEASLCEQVSVTESKSETENDLGFSPRQEKTAESKVDVPDSPERRMVSMDSAEPSTPPVVKQHTIANSTGVVKAEAEDTLVLSQQVATSPVDGVVESDSLSFKRAPVPVYQPPASESINTLAMLALLESAAVTSEDAQALDTLLRLFGSRFDEIAKHIGKSSDLVHAFYLKNEAHYASLVARADAAIDQAGVLPVYVPRFPRNSVPESQMTTSGTDQSASQTPLYKCVASSVDKGQHGHPPQHGVGPNLGYFPPRRRNLPIIKGPSAPAYSPLPEESSDRPQIYEDRPLNESEDSQILLNKSSIDFLVNSPPRPVVRPRTAALAALMEDGIPAATQPSSLPTPMRLFEPDSYNKIADHPFDRYRESNERRGGS